MGNNRYNAEETSQMRPDQAKRLRELEAENAWLRREVAVLTVDKLILKEAVEEND